MDRTTSSSSCPEAILSVGALAADDGRGLGRRQGRAGAITWLAVLALAAAAAFVPGVWRRGRQRPSTACSSPTASPPSPRSDHLCRRRDRHAGGDELVRARRRLSRRISGADPVLGGRHGDDGLGGAICSPSMSGSSCRASPPMSSPASSAATRARPRRASNISCSARSPPASCSTAFPCSTASPARPCSTASRAALGATASRPASCSASSSSSPASPSRSAPCRSTCGRRTSTRARRPRSPPSSPPRPRSRRWRCWSASSVEAMGPATDAWRQIVIFAALASTILGGVAAIGQRNIKRLLAYSSINNVGFALVGLAAGTPQGVAAVLFYMAVYVVMTLGTFLVVLRMRDAEGRAGRDDRQSLAGLSRTPAVAGARRWRCSCSASPAFRRCSASGRNSWCSRRRCRRISPGSRRSAIATSVIGAFYYLMIVKMMYFDEPAPAFAETQRARRRRPDPGLGPVRLAARLSRHPAAAATSGAAAINARRAALCSDPHRRRDGSTNDDRRRARARRRAGRAVAARRAADRRQGAAGQGVAVAAGQSLRQHPGPASVRAIRRRRRWRWSPRWRCTRRCRAYAPAGRGSNGRTTCSSTAPSWPASCSSGRATRWSIGFGVNLAHHPEDLDRPADQPRRARRQRARRRRFPRHARRQLRALARALARRGARAGPRRLARRRPSARHAACPRAQGEGAVRRPRRERRAAAALGGRHDPCHPRRRRLPDLKSRRCCSPSTPEHQSRLRPGRGRGDPRALADRDRSAAHRR